MTKGDTSPGTGDSTNDNSTNNNSTDKECTSHSCPLPIPLNLFLGAGTPLAKAKSRTNSEGFIQTHRNHLSYHAIPEPEEREEEEEEEGRAKRSQIQRNRDSRSRGTPDRCDRRQHGQDRTISNIQNDNIDTPSVLLDVAQEAIRRLDLDEVKKETAVDLRVTATADGDKYDEDGDDTSNGGSLSFRAGSSSCFLNSPQSETNMSPPFPLFSPSSASTFIDTSPLPPPPPIPTSSHPSPCPSDSFNYSRHPLASRPSSPARTLISNDIPLHPPIVHVDKNQYIWPTTTSSLLPPLPLSSSSSVNAALTITTATAPDDFSISVVTLPPFADQEQQKEQEVEEEGCLTQSHSHKLMDKGWKAWLVVLASVLIQTFAFAPTEFIFGVFVLEYLHMFPSASPSSIALIGTIGSSTTYLVGFFSGPFSDRWGYRVTSLIGTMIMTAALCLASFSTKVRCTCLFLKDRSGPCTSSVYF